MAYQHLLVGRDGDVVILKLARAASKNALNKKLISELREVLAKSPRIPARARCCSPAKAMCSAPARI